MENPQFLLKQNETEAKSSSHEVVTLTMLHDVWRKFVDFQLLDNFAAPHVGLVTMYLKR